MRCLECSGDFKLVGLDFYDEWVKYSLEPSSFGTYLVQLRCLSPGLVEYHLRLEIYPDKIGPPDMIDIKWQGGQGG